MENGKKVLRMLGDVKKSMYYDKSDLYSFKMKQLRIMAWLTQVDAGHRPIRPI